MKIIKFTGVAVLSLFLAASLAFAGHEMTMYKTTLSGAESVPAVASKAGGEAEFMLSQDGKEMTYTVTVRDLDSVTLAHIHIGKTGANGGPIVPLFGGPKKEGMFSGVLAKGTFTEKNFVGPFAGKTMDDLVKLIRDGGAYVNVHTIKNPAGEIRGQLK